MLSTCLISAFAKSGSCVHNAVFPANAYTAFIYTLIPPFTGIAILGGIGGII
jgi:hypothetical protein